MTVPSFSLEGKLAIVTGGRRGIGRALALAFAEAGADVVVCDKVVDDGELEAVAAEIQKTDRHSRALQVDTTVKSDVDSMVQRIIDEFGGIDILVNNAGIMIRKRLIDLAEEEWDNVIDVDLKGYFLCSQAATRIMIDRKSGNIINMASRGAFKPHKNMGAYDIAKAGVVMMTKVLAIELASYNIRVNAIAPGPVKTNLTEDMWSVPENLRAVEAAVPLGRWAEPDDMVGSVLFWLPVLPAI